MQETDFLKFYSNQNLKKLDHDFLGYLKSKNSGAWRYIKNARLQYKSFSEDYFKKGDEILEIAKYLEDFIVEIFFIKNSNEQMQNFLSQESRVFILKKSFINKKVKTIDYEEIKNLDFKALEQDLCKVLNVTEISENTLVNSIYNWLCDEKAHGAEILMATKFCALVLFNEDYYSFYKDYDLFKKVKKHDFLNQAPYILKDGIKINADEQKEIKRENFSYYKDSQLKDAIHNSHYCAKCHGRGKDSCRIGDKKEDNFTKNPLGVSLEGCPLGMHVSHAHILNESNNLIAALAVMTINNPILAGTGHNICFDCVHSCIFQKQERVNTPMVESKILDQVLSLPYGFEIYYLLTRWNPLRVYRPHPKKNTGKNILIVGLGPAGYSLAYNLLNEGHNVIGIDALKIEPLNLDVNKPIVNVHDIYDNLDERVVYGFGGVSEYGITTRWNKNYLKLIRILLLRHKNFHMQGALKFGSLLDFEGAFKLGFNHIAFCVGAGDPNLLPANNSHTNLVKGVRTASEFLMSLHMGAFKTNLVNSMQVRLPAVVLGGGLTAVDVATEIKVYYKRLLEKIVPTYLKLKASGVDFGNILNAEEKEIIKEYVDHYESLKNNIDIFSGKINIVYHKEIEQSKAYIGNHEEISSALKQGIGIIDNAHFDGCGLDEHKCLSFIKLKINNENITIPAKNLFLAMGIKPNYQVFKEHSDIFNDNFTKDISLELNLENGFIYKNKKTAVVLNKKYKNITMSILGDVHPIFKGSVVKAMASGFYAYESIGKSMQNNHGAKASFNVFKNRFIKFVRIKLIGKKHIAPNLLELIFSGKSFKESFNKFSFFKLQMLEQYFNPSSNIKTTEPVFLTTIPEKGNKLKVVISQIGASTKLIENINTDNFVIMGGLGKKIELPENKNILLIGGGVANVALISILNELKEKNNNITYIAGFKDMEKVFYLSKIKKYVKKAVFCLENKNTTSKTFIKGNVLDGLKIVIDNNKFDQIIVSGSSQMMSGVKNFLQNHNLANKAIASTNSYMNCGMGGVCGSCLQVNVVNGKEVVVYNCVKNQRELEFIDFDNLSQRLSLNSLQEKIFNLYIQSNM
jgi:NADPH-dependent glutamate synthase beta subunit-like oxidoreductase/NAD(P)H-flavin reductase